MSTDRLEALRAILAQNPNHTFARYGLAMEYANRGHLEEAVEEFRQLLAADPKYAAAYYHYGKTLEKLDRIDEARSVLETGIEVSTSSGDAHTCSELQAALELLGI
jgi:tetratricopeptide (TPR) repeat protein